MRSRAAQALAQFYEMRGDGPSAIRWLDQVRRERPDLMLQRKGTAVTIAEWKSQIAQSRGMKETGAVGFDGENLKWGEPVRLEGSLVADWESSSIESAGEVLLMIPRGQPRQLLLHDVTTGQPRWRIVAPNPNLRVVHLGRDTLLLWSPTTERLHALDAETGQALWPAISPEALLEELTGGGLAALRRENAGSIITELEADFGPIRQPVREVEGFEAEPVNDRNNNLGLRIVADEAVVSLVAGDGRAVGIDRYTGEVLWQWTAAVDRVTHVKVGDGSLAIAGLAAPQTESQAGRVLVIDAVTGRSRFPVVEDGEVVTHLQPTAAGDLLVITGKSIKRLARDDGATRWRRELGAFEGEPTVVTSGEGGVWLMDDRRLLSLDIATGETKLDQRPQSGRTVDALSENRWLIREADGVAVFNGDLELQWRDAIYAEAKRLVAHGSAGAQIIVAALPESQPRGRLLLYGLERDTGRLVEQTLVSGLLPNPVPERIKPMRGHILLAGRDWVVLLPLIAR